MLQIKGLRITLGTKTLFDDLDLMVNYGERAAIVGPNGAGKSTLFHIILGNLEQDRGTVERDQWTTVGYLPQESEDVGDSTAMDVAVGRAGEIQKLEVILREHEKAKTIDDPAYFEAQTQFDVLSDPATEAKAKKMLRGLGFRESDWDRPCAELSGGWIMRAHLARLLVLEPELLMLDEPTNHLDLESLLWFQHHLKNYGGAILMISHDREFMDAIVETVHDIDPDEGTLIHYTGNYSDFIVERDARYERAVTAYRNQQKEIDRLKEFADKFRSVASKASQAQSKLKEIERMDKIERPAKPRKPFKIQFPQPPRGGQPAISLEGVDFAYDSGPPIYQNLNLTIDRGDRIVLVGPNGAGKSTMLKMLAGEIEPQKGTRKTGHNCRLGYFRQHRSEGMDPNRSVLNEVLASAPEMREDEARGVLGSFLFRKEEVFKATRVLSGGEKSRLNLIKFLVDPPNLLLMDEPTTHLDILSIESLVVAMENYEGTLVFISHDVHFIKNLATKVVHISAGVVTPYAGGYDYFLEKTGAEDNARAAVTAGGPLGNEQA